MSNALNRNKDADPLYIQVAKIIRDKILSGEWKHDEALPPEKSLCVEFGIARGTLRQALQLLESEGYLMREQGRGTFIQQVSKNGYNSEQNRHLAFVVPYIRDSSVSTMLVGFQHVAEKAGYSVIFNHVNNDPHQQQDALQKLVQQGVMGIGLYPVDSDNITGIDKLVRTHYPIVLVDRYLKHLSTDFVMSDHFGGVLNGVHFLVDQGHHRVGFATWLSPAISMEHRQLGYYQAMRERGIEVDDNLICRVEGYPTINREPFVKWLSSPNRPSAVFAANDQIAIALYRAAATVGLQIPRDLSVIGFDNLDLTAHLDPPLTTVAQPFLEIGQQVANVLLSRIGGEKTQQHHITLSPELIYRDSCITLNASNFSDAAPEQSTL